MLIVHATLPIQAEHRDAFLGAVGGLVDASNQEEGVISYYCYESLKEPNTFMMVEHYKDEDAFNAHLASPHFQAAAGGLGGWVSAPPQIIKHEASEGVAVAIG